MIDYLTYNDLKKKTWLITWHITITKNMIDYLTYNNYLKKKISKKKNMIDYLTYNN